MKCYNYFLIYVLFFILNVHFSLAANFYLADHGTNVRTSSGNLLESGNLTIEIWDSPTGGNKIYGNNFTDAIKNGSWNVRMLLSLEYGNLYYKDYKINGEDLNFNNNERLAFSSPLGLINDVSLINFSLIKNCPSGSSIRIIYENGSVACEYDDSGVMDTIWNITGSKYLQNNSGILDINDMRLDAAISSKFSGFKSGGWSNSSANTSTSLNVITSGNISANHGLFVVLGTSTQRIAAISAQDIDASGNLDVLGNIKLNGIAINDWSDISTGKYAGGIYLYNDSSKIYLNESKLNEAINSRIPRSSSEGWANDSAKTSTSLNVVAAGNISTPSYGFFGLLGSLTQRITKIFTHDIDLSGNLKVSGNITLNEKTIGDWDDVSSGKYAGGDYLYNDSSRIYMNEAKLNSTINTLMFQSQDGWTNNSANESTSLNIVTEGNISAYLYGFFSWIGSPEQRINDILTQNLDVSGNLILNGVAINDWSDLDSRGKSGAGLYLYNDSSNIYFNETRLNNNIDVRSSSGAAVWQNGAWVSLVSTVTKDVNVSNSVFVKGDSGYVGINEISPSERLHVSGSLRVENASGKTVFFVNSRSGSTSLRRIAGISATPLISAGTGAGDSPSISIEGTDIGGEITVATGTGVSLPTDANIVNAKYSVPFPVDSYVVISPANSNAAMLSGGSAPYTTANSAGFGIISGTTGLNPMTVYIWNYIVVGR